MLNMMVALMPSMMDNLNIPIVVMGSVLGVRRLIRLPSAWVAGYLGDRWGRVAWLRCSSVIIIVATSFFSISWDFWSFVILSLVAEFAWAARGGLTSILVAEHSPAKHRGWLVGITNAFAFGATFGPLLGSWAISSGLSWRFPFRILVVLATINFIQSWFVKEPERFLELKKVRQIVKRGDEVSKEDLKYAVNLEEVGRPSIRQLLGTDLRKMAVIFAIFTSCSTVFWSNGSSYWTTFLPMDKGVTYEESLTIYGLLWAMAEPGFLTGSFFSQIIGRNKMMKVGFAMATLGSFVMVQFAYGFNQILLISTIMMFGAGLVYGTSSAYTSEIFPTRVRTIAWAWNSTVASIVQLIIFPLMPYCANIVGWSATYQLFITTSAFLCLSFLFYLPRPNAKAELEEIAK
jgi:MFS family permease